MFYDDLLLVREMTSRYGLLEPVADLGGLRFENLTLADYARTIQSGVQQDRYLKLEADPFSDIAPGYQILNPEYGDPAIEDLPRRHKERFGTLFCLSVLEHVVDPFKIFKAFTKLLKPGGLLILSTVFSFPKHSDRDYWRFSAECLKMLAESANFTVLDNGERLRIHGGMGVQEIHTGVPQEIVSVYVVGRK